MLTYSVAMIRWIFHFVAMPALLICALPSLAGADQNDPRLDTLFGSLQTADTLSEATVYVTQIWDVWAEHEDPIQKDRMNRGVKAMEDGDYVVAIGVFSNVIKADPEFAEGWNKRATVYYLLGRVVESQNDVNEVLRLEPRHFGALSGRGLLYAATGDLRNALRAFEEALAVNPFMPSVKSRISSLRQAIDELEI